MPKDLNPTDDWLDVLQGKAKAQGHAGQQAAELRGYFAQQQAAAASMQIDAEQEKRLLNGLRARGAFADAAAPVQQRDWLAGLRAWWTAPGHSAYGYGAAALLAFALVTVPALLTQRDVAPDGLPMAATTALRIQTAQPEQAAQRLQLLLSLHGLPSSVQRDGLDWRLSAEVPADFAADLRAELAAELKTRGVVLPGDGHLRLRFVPLN